MPTLISDCPRCNSTKITFDVTASNLVGIRNDWVSRFETFAVCRHCERSSIIFLELTTFTAQEQVQTSTFWLSKNHINDYFRVVGHLTLKDNARSEPPEHVAEAIAAIYREGATCAATECWNASLAMFRLCLDLATRPLLPDTPAESGGPNRHQRQNLRARVEWLLEKEVLPKDLGHLVENIREDGNDAAHEGSVSKDEAEDAADFAHELLRRVYTEPERIRIAQRRRTERRSGD